MPSSGQRRQKFFSVQTLTSFASLRAVRTRDGVVRIWRVPYASEESGPRSRLQLITGLSDSLRRERGDNLFETRIAAEAVPEGQQL
jgi:hypothetical protein